nr:tyrosine-type recombinase/integrase [Gemmata massiliana]
MWVLPLVGGRIGHREGGAVHHLRSEFTPLTRIPPNLGKARASDALTGAGDTTHAKESTEFGIRPRRSSSPRPGGSRSGWRVRGPASRPTCSTRSPGSPPANDRRHARREVPPHELGKLLDATRASERVYRRTMTGEDRYHLYLTAFATGFRLSELAALTPAHFRLEAEPPTVALPGKTAKNKKSVRPPLPPTVASALRAYLVGKPAKERIWAGKWTDSAAGMLKFDLEAAGVPYEVETPAGKEYADFHALRHTFVLSLAATGAGTKELQTLARHSDPRLTLNVYAHARSAALVEAVGRLQIPGAARPPPRSPT